MQVCKSQVEALDREYALCVVCTKSLPDVLPTTDLLWDALRSGKIGAYVLIQNGLDVEKELAAATRAPVVSCVAWIGVMTSPDGGVVKWAGVEKIGAGIYREDGDKPTDEEQKALDLWLGLVKAGEGNTVVADNIRSTRYAKVCSGYQAEMGGRG
jgi:2-dehydropantoate 2-reductase